MTNQNGAGRPPNHVHIETKKKGPKWLPWLLLALAALLLLLLLSRCNGRDETAAVTPAPTASAPAPAATGPAASAPATTGAAGAGAPATAALPVEQVTLPGGQTIALEPATLNYELQRYLGSTAPAPRTFTFDRLNFDTSSSAIRLADQPTVAALAQILSAYPNAKVRLIGYADARGTTPANAQLGAQRAQAVASALTSAGVSKTRITTASGGESNPADTNTTTEGRFENRRTELVVTSK